MTQMYNMANKLSVTLLPACTSTSTTEFLRFHPPGICDKQGPIVRHEFLLQLDCAECVDIFCIVCDNGLGNGLTDRIYLRSVSTTLDAYTDVNVCKGIFTSDKDGLIDLESQNLWLNEVDRRSIDADQAFSLTRMRNRSRCLFFPESLYGLCGRCHFVESQWGLPAVFWIERVRQHDPRE